ncbi:MAG: hypothetical protein CM1200mP4_3020 [Rhodospirillaceae bacterium]|nr:MAG: hypothetical protein CM1200mP4_3020 [Rhodospirillaceae bacterium]
MVKVWPLSPEIALGVMIIAAAPGGVTSNIFTSFAKGDVALSISLTAIISLFSVISVPLIAVFSYNHFLEGNIGGKSFHRKNGDQCFFYCGGSGTCRSISPPLLVVIRVRIETVAKRISTGLFVLVLLGAIANERANIVEYFSQAGLVTLTLNIL